MEFRIRPSASELNSTLNREWLLTNSFGDYASSSVQGCNTRRYHGLLAAQTPAGRYMLLSALEDFVTLEDSDIPLSSRIHPGVVWPEGYRFLKESAIDHDSVSFTFSLGGESEDEILLTRTIVLDRASCRLIVRYMLADTPAARALGTLRLTVRPLMNGRNINHLYPAAPARAASVRPLSLSTAPCTGFSFQPEEEIPTLLRMLGKI